LNTLDLFTDLPFDVVININ